jgi:hypothetical protein
MNYWSSDLGFRPTGAVVEVSLTGNAANVMLVDSSNLTSYKAGQSFRYVGGHYTVAGPARYPECGALVCID